jgi:hypothetical protein
MHNSCVLNRLGNEFDTQRGTNFGNGIETRLRGRSQRLVECLARKKCSAISKSGSSVTLIVSVLIDYSLSAAASATARAILAGARHAVLKTT